MLWIQDAPEKRELGNSNTIRMTKVSVEMKTFHWNMSQIKNLRNQRSKDYLKTPPLRLILFKFYLQLSKAMKTKIVVIFPTESKSFKSQNSQSSQNFVVKLYCRNYEAPIFINIGESRRYL